MGARVKPTDSVVAEIVSWATGDGKPTARLRDALNLPGIRPEDRNRQGWALRLLDALRDACGSDAELDAAERKIMQYLARKDAVRPRTNPQEHLRYHQMTRTELANLEYTLRRAVDKRRQEIEYIERLPRDMAAHAHLPDKRRDLTYYEEALALWKAEMARRGTPVSNPTGKIKVRRDLTAASMLTNINKARAVELVRDLAAWSAGMGATAKLYPFVKAARQPRKLSLERAQAEGDYLAVEMVYPFIQQQLKPSAEAHARAELDFLIWTAQ